MAAAVRAFLAIQPPADIRASLSQKLTEVQIDGAELRVVEQASIHLTIEFLGNTPNVLIHPLANLIERVVEGTSPFDLDVVRISAFPSNRPVVIAAELADSDALLDLVVNVRNGLKNMGLEPETRPFRPHITVARIKGGRNRVRGFSLAAEHTFTAAELILFKSDLSRSGARYARLHSARLGG